MPWCPRCDEVFPEGPACPRCRTRLVERERATDADGLESLPDLPTLKVSRRYRRAFDRLSAPKPPSVRVLVAAVTTLVFAVGFLLGRVATVSPGTPTVRALMPAKALAFDDVSGSAVYVLWSGESVATIAGHELYTGDVSPQARLSPPFKSADGVKTRMVSLQGSVALITSDGDRSFVASLPRSGAPHAWIPGTSAAWETPDRLLVLQQDGSVVRWSMSDRRVGTKRIARAERLLQTPTGAVMQRGGRFTGSRLRVPRSAHVLAVSADGRRAIVDRTHPRLWDGTAFQPLRVNGGYRVLAAAFEGNGADGADRAALVLARGDELTLAVVDAYGNAALKPLEATAQGCAPIPVWDSSGRWIYLSGGDGVLRAVEAGGGRVEIVHTRSLGCGLAWVGAR
jgi:hypothetical protein